VLVESVFELCLDRSTALKQLNHHLLLVGQGGAEVVAGVSVWNQIGHTLM
jgi:hypothetical protein